MDVVASGNAVSASIDYCAPLIHRTAGVATRVARARSLLNLLSVTPPVTTTAESASGGKATILYHSAFEGWSLEVPPPFATQFDAQLLSYQEAIDTYGERSDVLYFKLSYSRTYS